VLEIPYGIIKNFQVITRIHRPRDWL